MKKFKLTEWIPQTITKFQLNLKNNKIELANLGLSDKYINKHYENIDSIYKTCESNILKQICLINSCPVLTNNFEYDIQLLFSKALIIDFNNDEIKPIFNNCIKEIFIFDDNLLNGNIIKTDNTNNINNEILECIKVKPNDNLITLQEKFDNEKIYNSDIQKYNINRFSEFNKKILTDLINKYNNFIQEQYKIYLHILLVEHIKNNNNDCIVIYNKFMTYIVNNFCESYKNDNNYKILKENNEYDLKRTDLLNNLISINSNIDNLEKLHKKYN